MAVVAKSYLLEAGVHFGHQSKRWNPKMKEFIFTERDGIHIIDLQKTVEKIEEAYVEIVRACENGGKVLFVGTKKQASEACIEEAARCKSFYVTKRWLGGTLTNFKTIRDRVKRLVEIEKMQETGKFELLPKKEVAQITKEYNKLNELLCGIREMEKLPRALIVVDPRMEINAIREAKKLNIPVIGLVDTNCDPDDVDFVIPANDDAVRSVKVVLGVLANAVCEASGLPVEDYVSEDEFSRTRKDRKEKTEDIKVVETVVEVEEESTNVKIEMNKEELEKQLESIDEKIESLEKEEKTKKAEAKEESLDLDTMTVTDLKKLAKDKAIKGYSTMKKDELISSLK